MLKSWLIMRSPLPTDYTINPDWGQPYVVAEQNKTAAGQSKTKQNETKQNKTNITSGRINSFEPGKKPGKVTLQTHFAMERLSNHICIWNYLKFQSTLPAGGATSTYAQKHRNNLYFNPRSPRGERQPYLPAISGTP
jgi:hypothetical protein